MKKLFILLILTLTPFLNAQINAVVSIAPQYTFVSEIAGDKVALTIMVEPGNSPHSYEPKPSQMRDIAKADLYFSIGVEFEEAWLPRFANQNKKMKILDISKGIEKIQISSEEHGLTHEHEHESRDPHIWTSPKNTKIIANNIYKYLVEFDAKNKEFYKNNLDIFLAKITATDNTIRTTLNGVKKQQKFMVFHPSWGYFAKEYDLVQMVIEVEGKSPKPKDLINISREAKKENIKVIFVQPEFSDKIANTLAAQLQIEVIKVSPLSQNWSENLINLAKAINPK